MTPLNRKNIPPAWPFWLLIVAWFCANSPQSATFAVLAWAGEARSFSHQQRLSLDLARLLVGEGKAVVVDSAEESPSPPLAPAIPTEATLKKIELTVEHLAKAEVPAQSDTERVVVVTRLDGLDRARPPHEPPRAVVVS